MINYIMHSGKIERNNFFTTLEKMKFYATRMAYGQGHCDELKLKLLPQVLIFWAANFWLINSIILNNFMGVFKKL